MTFDIAAFAVRRWQFTLVAFALLTMLGINAFLSTPRSEDPHFPIPTMIVRAVLPGAEPAELEQLVADPIEDALSGLDDVNTITSTSLDGAAIIDIADNYGGVPYVRGGSTPKGFDCSGFTSYVFAQLGVDLPRTSESQYALADRVSFEDRQVGDLMFWANSGGVHHVGIYAGDGMMWDSPRPGRRVGKISIWGDPTYGRVPVEVINAAALEDIAEKTAALEEVKAQAPQLEITIDPENLLPQSGSTTPTETTTTP